jgi:hypothetical protein
MADKGLGMKEKPILFSTPMAQALLNTKPGAWPAEPIDPDRPFTKHYFFLGRPLFFGSFINSTTSSE